MSTEILEPDETARDEAGEFSREVVFEMFSNRRRRFVVRRLLDVEGETELRDLARTVAAWENGKRPDEITSEERRRAYNALQQVHLPKLDDAGLVRFDADRGTVSATDDLADLRVYLEIAPGNELSWSQYYLLLGAFCGSVTLAARVGLAPFATAPPLGLAAGTAVLFTLSAVAHLYHDRKMRLDGGERPPSV